MRLFIGLDIPPVVVENIERFQSGLRPLARINWSPPQNLHITTKFIGEWPEEQIIPLEQALRALPGRPPIEVKIRKVGFFPNPHSPRIFWCGIEAAGLAELAADTEAATSALGIAAENRPYSPHLTLARIKEHLNLQPLREAIAAAPSLDFGSFNADRFFLYRSQLQRGGSVYTKLAEFPFAQ